MIKEWARPKLQEYKRLADTKWHKSETTHYVSCIWMYDVQLTIELGPKERKDIPGSRYWYSVGYVTPVPDMQEFKYGVAHADGSFVRVNCWDSLVNILESDLKKYNRKMMGVIRENLELAIESLPG